MSNIIEKAVQLRKVIEQLADNLTDTEAVANSELFPKWQAGTNAYMTGNKVIYNGLVYESVINNNVWSPEAYPAGWKLITD